MSPKSRGDQKKGSNIIQRSDADHSQIIGGGGGFSQIIGGIYIPPRISAPLGLLERVSNHHNNEEQNYCIIAVLLLIPQQFYLSSSWLNLIFSVT